MALFSITAIVPAAGRAERMRSKNSKTLLKVGSKSVIERTLSTLLEYSHITNVILLVPKAEEALFRAVLPTEKRVHFVHGGETRRASVSNGLKFIREGALSSDLILIHDGARCFLSAKLLERCVAAAVEFGAVSAAMPIVETVKRIDTDGCFAETLDRKDLYAMQTPQVFRSDLIFRAHAECADDATDDVTLVQRIHPVRLVLGERENIKLTTPEDMAFAEAFLAS